MRRLAGALTTTAAALLLAGCGGGGNPEPAPLPRTTTPSPTATASASPTPPALPAAARQKTKAGAIAAVRHFLKAMVFAGDTGDTAMFADTYTRSCTRCEAIKDGIDATYSSGGSLMGGEWKPTQMKFYAIDQNIAYLDAVVTFDAQTLIRGDGTKSQSNRSPNNVEPFQLTWAAGTWKVAALDPKS